ncbi:MAG: hypothetical protein AAFN77_21025 [Planctomycetota bacterium]
MEILLRFVETTSENADIQIFTVDQDSLAVGHGPGQYGFGDIVLDNEHYSVSQNNTASLTPEQNFQIIRAVMSALGANPFVPELTRNESVVGVPAPENPNSYPQTLSYWDIEYLQKTYGESDANATQTQQALGATNGDRVRTISRNVYFNEITSGVSHSTDLRPGFSSTMVHETRGNQRYVNGQGVYIYRASGSNEADIIRGHHSNNLLQGRGGDDQLIGLGGDDSLHGGAGNDTYFYELGHGNDIIREPGLFGGANGLDTLNIRGKLGFDDFTDDLTFQRFGDHLQINLELDGRYNRNEGSIQIEFMSHENWRVESLTLENDAAGFGTYSLVSIFENATAQRQRFRPTGGSDEFGLIAAPV